MKENDIDAYIIPSSDDHQNEYVPDCWLRRQFISGFTGSAGDVVITQEHAGLWTDGRYFLQAEDQLDGNIWTLHRRGVIGELEIPQWIKKAMQSGQKVGLDPKTVSVDFADSLEREFEEVGIAIKFLDENLVDLIWEDRPPVPQDPISILDVKFAGETVSGKIKNITERMKEEGTDLLFLSALDSICWLFNIRGSDIEYNPVAVSYAMVDARNGTGTLFISRKKVEDILESFEPCVTVKGYDDISAALKEAAEAHLKVWIDPKRASRWLLEGLKGAKVHRATSPVFEAKAVKNATEIEGMKRAHIRDGVAMVKFFNWLEKALDRETVTELSAARKLEEIRSQGENFMGLSFETISGYKDHGAIIHYAATEDTDVELKKEGIYLLDSGAQYLDGTTDITRTTSLGDPTPMEKEMFTHVLKGHIDLAMIRYPRGTSGKQIDVIARKSLWDAGLNYAHGTGHGIGFYLNVHEGPQSISIRDPGVPLKVGMIISNEPGFYKEGAFGIRTESLVLVVEDDIESDYGPFYRFETITMCPIDLSLVDQSMMTPEEIQWLNDYHRQVREKLAPFLNGEEREWLVKATREL